jgi:hypothetical protein
VLDQAELHVRNETEIGRISTELAGSLEASPDTIESAVRAEFDRRASAKIQDFVPIFVERSLRHALRDAP